VAGLSAQAGEAIHMYMHNERVVFHPMLVRSAADDCSYIPFLGYAECMSHAGQAQDTYRLRPNEKVDDKAQSSTD
jgi:hypothetical protein